MNKKSVTTTAFDLSLPAKEREGVYNEAWFDVVNAFKTGGKHQFVLIADPKTNKNYDSDFMMLITDHQRRVSATFDSHQTISIYDVVGFEQLNALEETDEWKQIRSLYVELKLIRPNESERRAELIEKIQVLQPAILARAEEVRKDVRARFGISENKVLTILIAEFDFTPFEIPLF